MGMTREEAISKIEHLIISSVGREEIDETCFEIMKYLEEQRPVVPMLDIDVWRCGKCGHKLEIQELLGDNVLFHEQFNYCPQCGKKVKLE